MKKASFIIFVFCFFAFVVTLPNPSAYSKNLYKESEYQRLWCDSAGGRAEYVLPDRTRVDCLTDEYAVEVDFARKWAEAIGQALYYATVTGKRPAVLLIMERPTDARYLLRLKRVAATTSLADSNHRLKVMTITPAELHERRAESLLR